MWMFLKLSSARLEAVLAGATLLQGGRGLQPRWDTCLLLCTAGTADSQDRAVWAQVRASELGLGHASWLARQVWGISAQAASHHFVGAVHVCGLCS